MCHCLLCSSINAFCDSFFFLEHKLFTMVFRDTLKEPKLKVEGAGRDSTITVNLQNGVQAQFPAYLEEDMGISQKNLQSLASILLTRNVNNNIGKGLLERQMLGFDLEQISLEEMEHSLAERTVENRDVQASDDSFLPGLHEDTALDILAWSCRSDYPILACVNKKFKKLLGSGYLYRLRRRLGVIEHWVYLACILMPWEAFDPVRQRWMRLPRMPCDECFTYADKESLAVGTELLVFGRELSGFAIWMYSLLSHE